MGSGKSEDKFVCTALGKHDDDVNESMKLLTNWMLYVTKDGDINLKKRVLRHAALTLQALENLKKKKIITTLQP